MATKVLNLQNTLRVEGTSVLPDFRITHFDDYQAYLGHQETNSESDEAAELSFEQLLKDKKCSSKSRAALANYLNFSGAFNGAYCCTNE